MLTVSQPDLSPQPVNNRVDQPGITRADCFQALKHVLRQRLAVDVHGEEGGEVDLTRPVPPGERGRVVVHRLDESFFLPNLVERDEATRVEAPAEVIELGYARWGLRDPAPVPQLIASSTGGGLY